MIELLPSLLCATLLWIVQDGAAPKVEGESQGEAPERNAAPAEQEPVEAVPVEDQGAQQEEVEGESSGEEGAEADPEAGGEEPNPAAPVTESESPPAGDSEELRALLDRDKRLTFDRGTAHRARVVVEAGSYSEEANRAALIALGAAGEVADRPLLESRARVGTPAERRNAVLALGELGPVSADALLALDNMAKSPEDKGVLCLALWRCGAPHARARVRSMVGGDLPIEPLARVLVETDGEADLPMVRGLYEWRYDAARLFGFIDGRRWRDHFIDQLFADPTFQTEVVLGAARVLRSSAVLDHVGNLAFSPGVPARLTLAIELMPAEVTRRIDSGSFTPADEAEWDALFLGIQQHHLERQTLPILRLALDVPRRANQARLLILRAGGEVEDDWIALILAGAPKAQRLAVLDALGEGGHTAWSDDLWAWVEGSDLDLAAGALVALTRMPDELAKNRLRERLIGADDEERAALLKALARGVHDPFLRGLCVRALGMEDLDPVLRARIELALAREGRIGGREILRGLLAPNQSEGVRRMTMRALADSMGEPELELLRSAFPIEDEEATNVLMAEVFVRHREPVGMQLLRHVLWHAEWDLSILAGGLLLQMGGVHVLLEELDSPPRNADEADLRRIGFAIGEFGGPGAVERLESRRSGGDAVLQGAYLGALTNRTR